MKYCEIKVLLSSIKITKGYYIIESLNCSVTRQKAIAENLNEIYPKTVNTKIYKIKRELPEIPENSINIERVRIKNQRYYNTKREAINDTIYYKEKRLISQDLTIMKGHKRFYLMTYKELWNKIKSNKIAHYYENFEKGDALRLFIDIDYKKKRGEGEMSYDKLLEEVIETIDNELEKYNRKNTKKIILSSNREEKNSAHIIYPEVYFRDITYMKVFMMDIKSPLITKKIIDPSVYKVGCFRIYLNSKKGINVPLIYYKGINHEYKNELDVFYQTLLRNIKPREEEYIPINIPENIKIREIKGNVKNINLTEKKMDIDKLRKYLFLLGKEHGEAYMDWTKIGIIIHNCNGTMDGFNLWDEWSKQFSSYGGRDICAREWNKFKLGPIGIGTLIKLAKDANPIEYSKICYKREVSKFESIKYCKEYNLDRIDGISERIKERRTIVTQTIDDWMTTDCKTLSIKSPYRTGKTTLIGSILSEYDPRTVLFVSYRQSLSNSIYGTFKKHKFCNYMDKQYSADRLICQLESLKNIEVNIDYENGEKIHVPSYELIIMDEIESVLNHFDSPTVTEKEFTFGMLMGICSNSRKILALDGDFGNRSYDFVENYGKNIVLENTVKKDICTYIFTNNMEYFEEDIDKSLLERMKVVIISMTSKMSEHYYNKYNGRYATIIHNSHTDDKIKEKLKNVTEYWITCQLLIYTPSVEAGVDFDMEYFDKKYVVLSQKSCSPRALCQMTGRVRQTSSNVILSYLGKMPYYENIGLYTYEEVEMYVKELHNKYITPHIVHDNKTNKYCLEYMNSPYTKLIVYNEQEKLNKQRNYFMAQLLSLLISKGHECKLLENDVIKTVKIENFHIKNIITAQDLDEGMYNALVKKQEGGFATRDDKCAIEKHLYKLAFNIKKIDADFMKKYYGKIYMLRNLKAILNDKKLDISNALENDESQVNFINIKKAEMIDIIKELINLLGFDTKKINEILIDKEQFEENIIKCKKTNKLFTEPKKYRPMFELSKCKVDRLNTTKDFLSFLNKTLKEWGLKVESKWVSIRNNDTVVKVNKYSLNYYKNLNIFLPKKREESVNNN